jgi:uncharacterized membrane protein
MVTPTIKSCFISGATALLANMLVYFIIPPLFILTSNLLPGFAFGFVILSDSDASTARKSGFLLISGGLFIAAAFLVTGHSFSWQKSPYIFSLASTIAAVCLLVSYKFLLDNSISLTKGIPLVAGTSLLAALLPTLVLFTSFRTAGWPAIAGVLSVYITWQTLFGWVLNRTKAAAVANRAPVSL